MTANNRVFRFHYFFVWKMLILLPKPLTNSTGYTESSKFKVLQIKPKKHVTGFKYVKEKDLLFFEGGNIANVSFWM